MQLEQKPVGKLLEMKRGIEMDPGDAKKHWQTPAREY
jgi:hypothetical protein